MADDDTRHYSAAQLERMAARGDYVPTRADAPEIELDEDFWRHAHAVTLTDKTSVRMHLDSNAGGDASK